MNTTTQTIKVYNEIIELIARGTTPQSVINFHLSDTAQNRLEDLIYNSKNNELTQDNARTYYDPSKSKSSPISQWS